MSATAKSLYPGDTLKEQFTITDPATGELFDPGDLDVVIKNPADTVIDTLHISDLTRSATGVYVMEYNFPDDAEPGVWPIYITANTGADSSNLKKTVKFLVTVLE